MNPKPRDYKLMLTTQIRTYFQKLRTYSRYLNMEPLVLVINLAESKATMWLLRYYSTQPEFP